MSTLIRIGAAAALVALAACGDRGERAPGAGAAAGDTPEPGGTVVIAELADLSRPLPIIAESSADGSVGGDVMFSSLLRGAWRDGRLLYVTHDENPAALARSWELIGDDSTALRYHLQPGLRWSDGEPITAADVVWTYEMLRHPDVGSPQQNYAALLDSVVADDANTVTFHFQRRYPEMLFHSGIGIAPRHALSDVEPAQLRNHPRILDPTGGRLPVSGPFMIGEWRRGQQVTLVPNPHFPRPPHLERIVWRVIPEATTRLTELLNGTVDFTRPISFDQIAELRQRGQGVEFEREEKRFYDYIGYNPQAFPAFADPEVRRALSMAVDVPGMIGALQMDDWAEPAGGPYSPIFTDLRDEGLRPLAYDTAEAGRILQAKGWVDRDGDGIREDAQGRPFRFSLLTNAGNSRRADISQIVQQQWRRIGVDVRLQTMETNTLFERLREKRYEAALAGWQVGLSPDLATLWGAGSPFNFVSYENPRTTQLMEQAVAQPTDAAAAPFWRQAAAQIVADRPYTWLFYFDQVAGRRSRVRGMTVDTYGAYQNTWEWWIPRSEQRLRSGAGATDTSTASGDTAAADTTG